MMLTFGTKVIGFQIVILEMHHNATNLNLKPHRKKKCILASTYLCELPRGAQWVKNSATQEMCV